MNHVRLLLVACLIAGSASAMTTAGCAERPGKKKEDKDTKKGTKQGESKQGESKQGEVKQGEAKQGESKQEEAKQEG